MNIIKKLKPLWLILLIATFLVSYDLIYTGIVFSAYKVIPDTWFQAHGEWTECLVLIFQISIYSIIYKRYVLKMPPQITFSPMEGVWKSVLLGLGIAGIILLWNVFVEMALSNISVINSSIDDLEQMFQDITVGSYIAALLSIGIMGPIAEELLLRGLIFNTLERIYAKPWFAIVISSVIFGIMHGNFVQSVYAFVAGLFVSFIYYKTRTLKWPILIHIIINTSGTLPPALNTGIMQNIVSIMCFIMIIPVVYTIYRMARKKPVSTDSLQGQMPEQI